MVKFVKLVVLALRGSVSEVTNQELKEQSLEVSMQQRATFFFASEVNKVLPKETLAARLEDSEQCTHVGVSLSTIRREGV